MDAVAFGASFLAKPDLSARIETGAVLNQPDLATLCTWGVQEYTVSGINDIMST
ncbi:hypothetical protein [Nitrosomonas sp.]|uniref:hypothetical protein n=1 Tax=Nitrosomonas sp. TaxID=42353 RepID=UPI0025EF4ED4|nr:hypothetical protein [Nitrosomonas sp.]